MKTVHKRKARSATPHSFYGHLHQTEKDQYKKMIFWGVKL